MLRDVNLTKCYLTFLSEVKVKKANFLYMTSRKQIGEVLHALIFEAQVKNTTSMLQLKVEMSPKFW